MAGKTAIRCSPAANRASGKALLPRSRGEPSTNIIFALATGTIAWTKPTRMAFAMKHRPGPPQWCGSYGTTGVTRRGWPSAPGARRSQPLRRFTRYTWARGDGCLRITTVPSATASWPPGWPSTCSAWDLRTSNSCLSWSTPSMGPGATRSRGSLPPHGAMVRHKTLCISLTPYTSTVLA